MVKWAKTGKLRVFGNDNDSDEERYGAVLEEEDGEDWDTGAVRRPMARPIARPPLSPPGRRPATFRMPGGLNALLARAPKEVFSIYPGIPDTGVSGNLVTNTSRTQSAVHTFKTPTGHFLVLDPGDIGQEVLFTPYGSQGGSTSSDFIIGLIEIFAKSALGGVTTRVYTADSMSHRTDSQLATIGQKRKWQVGAVLSPGDQAITYFTSRGAYSTGSEVIHTLQTILEHRVTSRKIAP